MQQDDVELHALACEIADLDGLDYREALERAHKELGAVQQYASDWNRNAVTPSVHYLEALALLEHGANLSSEQVQHLITHDQVVRYIWQHVANVPQHAIER